MIRLKRRGGVACTCDSSDDIVGVRALAGQEDVVDTLLDRIHIGCHGYSEFFVFVVKLCEVRCG